MYTHALGLNRLFRTPHTCFQIIRITWLCKVFPYIKGRIPSFVLNKCPSCFLGASSTACPHHFSYYRIPGAEVPGLDAIFFKHCDNSTGRRINFGRPRWMCILIRSPRQRSFAKGGWWFFRKNHLEDMGLNFWKAPGNTRGSQSGGWAVQFPPLSQGFRWSFGGETPFPGKHIYWAVLRVSESSPWY